LTFKAPSAETHMDLDLPATRAALASSAPGRAQEEPGGPSAIDLENDLVVRAEADDLGNLKALRLVDASLPDLVTLGDRLRRYTELLSGQPLHIRLIADDALRYEPAARIIATCSSAGVSGIRLTRVTSPNLVPSGGRPPANDGTTPSRAKPSAVSP
jgi:hypothetical protein